MNAGQRRLLNTVGAVVLIEAVFYSAIVPLLPHYASAEHLSKSGVGVLLGAYTLGSFAAAIPGGLMASRIGVKFTLLTGLVTLGVASAAFGLTRSIWLLDLIRVCQGAGAALSWTGALAWLVAATPASRRGELIGRALAAAAFGGLVGPSLGALAAAGGTGRTFLVFGVVTLALAAWTALLPDAPAPASLPARVLLASFSQPTVIGSLWLMVLPSIMVGAVGVLAPLRLSQLGLGATVIGGIFVVAAAVESLSSVLSGRWADRSGRYRPLVVSLVAVIAFSCVLSLAGGRWQLTVAIVFAAAAYGAFFAPAMALLTDVVEGLAIGPAFGFALLMAAWAPGQLLGSVGGGALASSLGDSGPYLVLAAMALLTLAAVHTRRFRSAAGANAVEEQVT